MAGIYIHIPFCKKACHYCNFHFSTNLQRKTDYLAALRCEIALQKDYLQGETIQTVYLGGGTPSLLSASEINEIWQTLLQFQTIADDAEVTLEANPDDLTDEYLSALRQTRINRLSIGIQSFADADLTFFNRAHNATEAEAAIRLALQYDFTDISVDLIYGSPTTTDAAWLHNLSRIADLPITHLSCYALTLEPKTALDAMVRKGKAPEILDETAEKHWRVLQTWLPEAGFEQYEISNFARNGRYAKHNTAYWQNTPYLGLGASAHSFDGVSRQWNVAHNALYISSLQQNILNFEIEKLTPTDATNEYIMTALRTKWGLDLAKADAIFNKNSNQYADVAAYILAEATPFLQKKQVVLAKKTLFLTTEGKLYADAIAAELFL
jgi:oxygen-independent coproporphyrinogen III oxidase